MMNHSAQTKAVLALARRKAISLSHMYIGTEHILYAILSSPQCKIVWSLLKQFELERIKILAQVKLNMEPQGTSAVAKSATIVQTPRVKKILSLGENIARRRLTSSEIEPIHLLLGIVLEGSGVASIALGHFPTFPTFETIISKIQESSVS